MALVAESTRPAALSVRAAAVSAARSALLHAPSAPTHSAKESLVNRSAWPVMFPSPMHGGPAGSRCHATGFGGGGDHDQVASDGPARGRIGENWRSTKAG